MGVPCSYTAFLKWIYSFPQQTISCSFKCNVACNCGDAESSKSFLRFIKVLRYKIATALSRIAFVTYIVHDVLMNRLAKFCRWEIENGHNVIGILPARGLVFETYFLNSCRMAVCVVVYRPRWGSCRRNMAIRFKSECPSEECVDIIWSFHWDSEADGGCWVFKCQGWQSKKQYMQLLANCRF